MEFREYYRGLSLHIRFDTVTGTYIGELVGVPETPIVQGGSYEEILAAMKQAVDEHLSRSSATSTEEKWERATRSEQAKARAEAEEKKEDDESVDEVFKSRRFLR